MALGGCYSCIKYLMFAFNFIFWLLGCAILGVGIWLRVDPNLDRFANHEEEIDFFHLAAYVLMAIGLVIMIIGFLGCCGAIRESQWMLGVFFVLLFIIFAVLLGFGIWAVVEKDMLKEHVGDMLQRAVDNYNNVGSKKFMDTIQTEFHCCGARKGSEDYMKTMNVPDTCEVEYRDKPCEKELSVWLAAHLIIVAGVAIAVSFVLILGMIFSITLCCAIQDTAVA